MRYALTFLCAATGALAAPASNARQSGPQVTISRGTVVGKTTLNVDTFEGIPFAQPPVGNLRLKPPQKATAAFPGGTFDATKEARSCVQLSGQVDTGNLPQDTLAQLQNSPLFQTITNSGEDCLTLNVQRPSSATSTSKLPVVVWIFGGGFQTGSTRTYNADSIIRASKTLDQPIIYVAMNYRLAGLGFLASKEMQADGSTNLGLRDQRLALEWVADNIAAFGGDPDKVTIWGESAGALSVYDQTVINGGDHTYNGKPLFRGAIMNSGSFVPAEDVTSPKPQAIYDRVVSGAGCSGSADTLACLRSVSIETFQNAMSSVPTILTYAGLDLPYLPRPDPKDNFFSVSPEVALFNGKYAKVPIIIGDQEDEGTLFSLSVKNLTTTQDVETYYTAIFPNTTPETVNSLVATYPEASSAGSPFRTGELNDLYPEFKRVAAISGDVVFNLRRRQYLDVVSSVVPSWSYLDSHLYGLPIMGTFHGSDVVSAFYNIPYATNGYTFRAYYISFINNLDPNAFGTKGPLIAWPKYDSANRQMVQFRALKNDPIKDDWRTESFNVLQSNPSAFKV